MYRQINNLHLRMRQQFFQVGCNKWTVETGCRAARSLLESVAAGHDAVAGLLVGGHLQALDEDAASNDADTVTQL